MTLRFGAHYAGPAAKQDIATFAGRLEALGFDSLWCAEGSLNRDSLTILTAAAAVCDLQIGTAVIILPFRDPLITARQVATLDQIAGGRLILGVGVAGERLNEFRAYGLDPKLRGPRSNEALRLMLRFWQEEEVTHEGRFFHSEGASLSVRPLQQPHPPIWVGGRLGGQGVSRDAGLKRLARYGDGWLPYLLSPEQYATGLERLGEYASERGRDAAAFTRALQVNVALYDSHEEAMQVVMAGSARAYGLNEQRVDSYYAIGSASNVVERLNAYVAAGVQHFVFQWACRREDIAANLETLGAEVLPEIKRGLS